VICIKLGYSFCFFSRKILQKNNGSFFVINNDAIVYIQEKSFVFIAVFHNKNNPNSVENILKKLEAIKATSFFCVVLIQLFIKL